MMRIEFRGAVSADLRESEATIRQPFPGVVVTERRDAKKPKMKTPKRQVA